jgi:SAM-dependent methyltransferase
MTPFSRLINAAFELLYGPAVPIYDWVSRTGFTGEWARWQRVVLRYIHSGPVLEIGSGTGDLLPLLAAQGLRPCGVEPSPQMFARARRKLARLGQTPPLVRGRADALPFADGAIGAVVATFPSAWVFQAATWDEIARVLRPGGVVAIVLSGELAPHGAGRALRAQAYRLLYQPLTPDRLPPPPPSAIPLRWEIVPTRHGRALVLIGQKPGEA